ncbi:MAG TPA: c-type cytochrome [Candidatus Nanopelagicaceae bacterium]
MKRISRFRRHRIALPVLVIAALFTIGTAFGVASALPGAQSSITTGTSTLVSQGKAIFLRGCSSCHGLHAEGGSIAPSLIGVGSAAVDFQVGTGRMPLGDESQQAMEKKPIYNPQETAALAAFIASLAPGPASVTNESLAYERDGNSALGGQLFRTNCAMCHNFAGQGGALTNGKYAPTLMGVDPKYIYEAMMTGPQSMPKFTNATITPQEKLSIIKWLQAADNEPNLGGASLGRVGPVTEGLLGWVLGLGLLIGAAVWLAMKAK